jgi:hypothetical protein
VISKPDGPPPAPVPIGSAPIDTEKSETRVREELKSLTERLGEHAIGGPRHPDGSATFHRVSDLEAAREDGREYLLRRLTEWFPVSGPERVWLLVCLWRESWKLWDATLAYRTLQAVGEAAAAFAGTAAPEVDQGAGDWERRALWAVSRAMSLITADGGVFKQVNLSSAEGLKKAAETAAATTAHIRSELASLGPSPWRADDGFPSLGVGLRQIEDIAGQTHEFYAALIRAAEALIEFESWLAAVPRRGSAQPPPPAGGSSPAQSGGRVLASIDAAIDEFGRAQKSLNGDILSRCEPWERLLVEIREIVSPSNGTATVGRVFVPKRAAIQYCYPFAVEANEQTPGCLDALQKDELDEAFGAIGIEVSQPGLAIPTMFFDPDSGHYGGRRVDLPDIEIRYETPPGVNSGGREERCKVWIYLAYMGNHCLCIQPEPLDTPLPHLLYRALKAGTPVTLGATVRVAGTTETWDNLHLFSRDVIKVIATAGFWPWSEDPPTAERFVRGNLHEIVVVNTDSPLGTHPEEIADALDRAVGGRILAVWVQRAVNTLEEWVRYPPVPRTGRQGALSGIVGMPELGLAGDWCTHTGETTVFGIVATPSWQSDAYLEAAQFVSSWLPLLRLWSSRLLNVIKTAESPSDKEGDAGELRLIESQVRLHLAQTKAEELTATLAPRFLDQLLGMAGLGRLQGELEAQLAAAERLTDWFNEQARLRADEEYRKNEERRREDEGKRQRSDQRRNLLLGVIGLFTIFELGTFLGVVNTTKFRAPGVWEVWLMLALFVLALLAGAYFFNQKVEDRLNKYLDPVTRKLRSTPSEQKTRRLYSHGCPDTVPRPAGRCGSHRGYLSRDPRAIVRSR